MTQQIEHDFDDQMTDQVIDRDSHGFEGFIPDWDPEVETEQEFEARILEAMLPYI